MFPTQGRVYGTAESDTPILVCMDMPRFRRALILVKQHLSFPNSRRPRKGIVILNSESLIDTLLRRFNARDLGSSVWASEAIQLFYDLDEALTGRMYIREMADDFYDDYEGQGVEASGLISRTARRLVHMVLPVGMGQIWRKDRQAAPEQK